MFENAQALLDRAEAIKQWMKQVVAANPVSTDEKFAVICHSKIIAALTAEGLDPNDPRGIGFKNYSFLDNC
jgi:hypothetical protein